MLHFPTRLAYLSVATNAPHAAAVRALADFIFEFRSHVY